MMTKLCQLIYVNEIHRYKKKVENIKTKELILWRQREKTTGRVMINTFFNISSRLEEILHHLCKFYATCTIIW